MKRAAAPIVAALLLALASCGPGSPTEPPVTEPTASPTTTTLPGEPSPSPTEPPPVEEEPAPPGAHDCQAAQALSGYIEVENPIEGEHVFAPTAPAARSLAAAGSSVQAFATRLGATNIRTLGGGRYAAALATADARTMAASPQIQYVQQVQAISLGPLDQVEPSAAAAAPSWGLARVTHRTRGGSEFNPAPGADGQGVTVVILDTGVNPSSEFGDRLLDGYSTVGGSSRDGHGHGTHVAGTAAGATFGIARAAEILPVKVLGDDGTGTTITVARGIEVTRDYCSRPGVRCSVNVSLGGGIDPTLDAAMCGLAEVALVSIAGGNDGRDACGSSPGRAWSTTIDTVGATTPSDSFPSWSNRGECLRGLAPGENIRSVGGVMSGTSMSAPHKTGQKAALWSLRPAYTARQVAAWAREVSTQIAIGRLVYVGQEVTQ